jgi:peptidase M28-like protein
MGSRQFAASLGIAILVALGAIWRATAVPAAQAPAARWWSHVEFLASDEMQGRETGSPQHRKAAQYVAEHFAKAGLKTTVDGSAASRPDAFLQTVPFSSSKIVEQKSSLALVRNGAVDPVVLGDEATINMRIEPAAHVEAPIVFVGHGLTVPERGHDDLAGVDLKGKIAMILTGGPSSIPGPLLAHYQQAGERWAFLKQAGAIGVLSIQNPRGQDIPWERSMLARFNPAMAIRDRALDETAGQQIAVTINPARADKFLAGSGHDFKSLLALHDAGRKLPAFPVPAVLRADVSVATTNIESQNVAGIWPGTDPVLKHEFIVVTAHLDHLGVGQPIRSDEIYNGAMDNASGIATLLEVASRLGRSGVGLRRSLVFLAVTAEEHGLLGSRYYAMRPTVPASALVANLNTDMFLPLFPMRSLIVSGVEESDLADDLRRVARPAGIEILTDPEPERNGFVRSDQYSFIRRGVPALAFKIGWKLGSPEHEIVKRWRAERYHAPSDDLGQPIDLQSAEDFTRFYTELTAAVANRPTRPRWNDTSFFKRFATE